MVFESTGLLRGVARGRTAAGFMFARAIPSRLPAFSPKRAMKTWREELIARVESLR